MRQKSVSLRLETRLSARLSETCIEALWVGLSLWVGTSDLPMLGEVLAPGGWATHHTVHVSMKSTFTLLAFQVQYETMNSRESPIGPVRVCLVGASSAGAEVDAHCAN